MLAMPKIQFFWDVRLCGQVRNYRHSERSNCLNLQTEAVQEHDGNTLFSKGHELQMQLCFVMPNVNNSCLNLLRQWQLL
jgi:hypothetical protein